MTSSPPLVSAVIAVYNGERFIGDAIDSVLSQTLGDLELLVVDDGSTDGTAAVIEDRAQRDPRVRYVHQANQGVSRARNHAISLAAGEVVAFLDADDLWLPDKLEQQVALLRRRPELGLVFCGYVVVDEELNERSSVLPHPRSFDMLAWLLLEGDGMGLAFTGLVPLAVVAEVGGFDETLSTSADLDFAYRIASRFPVDAVPAALSLYRQHDAQMHLDVDAFEHDVLQLYEAHFGDSGRFARLRVRATANLHARLFWLAVMGRDVRRARRNLVAAMRLRPSRLLLLPLRVAVRRVRRRLRSRGRRWTDRPQGS